MNTDLPPAIFLMGPTAAGKTELAIGLTQRLPCEIISVDSAMIYRGMDIGTAKPSAEELAQAPHRLIDILDPAQSYSAADFRQDALQAMQDITDRGKIPLLVGGTMMYFKVLLEGMSPLPAADKSIRADIESDAASLGWDTLHQQLSAIDPVAARRIHPNDPQRLTRALEVYRLTGKSLTELSTETSAPLPYHVRQFAIAPDDRSILHERIARRFALMLQHGFEQEVRKLFQRSDLHEDLPAIRCVGYRQMWDYLQQRYDQQTMTFRAIVATRQLAKRQLTWLRSWQNLNWLDTFADNNLEYVVSRLSDLSDC